MALTAAQLQTLKTYIAGQGDLNAQPNTPDGAYAIAEALKLNASPNFTVYKTNVPLVAVGYAFNGAELAGLTTGNQTRLQTVAAYLKDGVNPSLPSNRAFFDDIFSGAGGVNTRAALLLLWKRLANRGEKLYATGTGSDATPATLVVEGSIDYQDVYQARNMP